MHLLEALFTQQVDALKADVKQNKPDRGRISKRQTLAPMAPSDLGL